MGAVLLAATIWLAVAPASALAHAGLVSSEPSAGARLGASPDVVKIDFSEQPEASLSEIRVLGPGGEPEQVGRARPSGGDSSLLEVPVRRLGKGVYTVDWKVLSAVDGHTGEGSFAFGVRASPTGAAASEGTTTNQSSGFELLARWVFLLGVIALLGGAVAGVARFGGEGSDLALAAAGLAAAAVGLVLLADAERIDAGSSLGALLGSSVGSALIWRAATLALAGGALLLAWRRPPLRRVALLGVAAATLGTVVVHAGAGHADAGSWPSALTVSAQVAHIAAASVWLGGLAALVLGFRGAGGAARGEAVRRFAPIALAAVAVLFATGVLRAVDELVSWDDLLSTGYGRAVLAKLVLLALIAAIAARNRPRRRPLGAGELEGMRRRSRFELGLGILAVGLAALLGTLAPPSSTQRAPLGLEAGGHDFGTTVRAELTTASNEPGPNRFQLRVAGYDSGAPVAADSVSLRFTPLDDPSVLPSSLTLQKGSDGSWVGSGANVLFDGRWAIGALIERGGDAVEVPLQLDFPVPEQFVSVLDIPGSSRPPQYTLQTEDGFIRLTPSPDRAGRNRFYLRTFSAFENSVAGDQIVVTAASAAGPTRQLPVQRLGPARFVAVAPLAAGPVEVGVFARTQYGSRLRGVFKLEIPN